MPVDKRAGQRAKFTRSLADYQRTDDDDKKHRAALLMAEVLRQAPTNGFTELEVTQGADVPDEVRRLVEHPGVVDQQGPDDADQLTKELKQRVDSTAFLELGDGSQSVYAYGYHCVPGRLKVGRTDGEVIDRIVRQINESTPERPVLSLVIRTENARVACKRFWNCATVKSWAAVTSGT